MSYSSGLLGATLDRFVLRPEAAPPAPVQGYANTVINLSGGAPIAYWRLGDASTVIDHIGSRHGTYSGTVALVTGLPTNSDGAIDFAGTGSGTVPHDSGLSLNAFTLSFWFQMHSFPASGAGSMALFGKEPLTGVNDCDTSIYVGDAGDLTLRIQQGGLSHILTSAVVLDTSYHLALRADSTGFDAYLNGQFLSKNTNVTLAWSGNTAPIQLATSSPITLNADAILDEVALYPRVITQAEVLALAQHTAQLPVAVNDSASVPESATTAIDVVANDTFTGTKAELDVEVVSQPTGGDSAAVNASNNINYTAGAVSADTQRSFTYRITDSIGTSAAATVNVTVQDAAAPPSQSNFNCFPATSSDTVTVSSMSALQSAVNAAPAGRHILIAGGSYSGGTLTFNRDGTAANPIVIRPVGARGSVTINNADWTWADGSSRLVFTNLHFSGGVLRFAGTNNRISRCRMLTARILMESSALVDCRVDHMEFSGDIVPLNFRNCRKFITGAARFLCDHTYFHDIPGTTTQVWTMFGDTNGDYLGLSPAGRSLTFDTCLIQDSGHNGEFVTQKVSGMMLRKCTFLRCNGEFELRSAFQTDVISCWFEDIDGAIKIWGANHKIHGNRVVGGMDIWCPIGNNTTEGMIADGPQAHYARCEDAEFIGNRLDTGNITVGNFWTGAANPPATFPARDCIIQATTRDSGGSGVTFQNGNANNPLNPGWVNVTSSPNTSIPFTAASKLTPSNVGLSVADPFCPSGPQS